MYYIRLILVFIIFTNAIIVRGQNQDFVLKGQIHVTNGETYPYQLFFKTKKDTAICGYSITKLPDGTEPKIKIKGHLDRQKHILTFSEKKLVSDLPQNFSMCLVDATLKYRSNAKNLLSGTFTSKDNDNKLCGKGTLEFESSVLIEDLFRIDTVIPKKEKTTESPDSQTGEIEITSGVSKQFDWYSDTCTIEINDGGLIDGDEISLIFNNHTLLNDYPLTKQKKILKLPLLKKLNTITIVAGYEGKIPPNTASIIISDGKVHYKIKANNNAGDKATIIINRK